MRLSSISQTPNNIEWKGMHNLYENKSSTIIWGTGSSTGRI